MNDGYLGARLVKGGRTGMFAMAIAVAGIASLGTASKALADGHGQRVYNQCRACHVLDAGVNRVGPSLADLNGRTAGTVDGFRYSPALADSGIVWNEETLKAYLTDPRGYIPGNRMAFRGIRKEEDLDALVDYLFGDD